VASIAGTLRRYVHGRGPAFERFVAEVNTQAEGLNRLHDKELTWQARALRRRLYAEGLRDDLVAKSFAMVREFASGDSGCGTTTSSFSAGG